MSTTDSKRNSMALVKQCYTLRFNLREGLNIFPEIFLNVVFRFAQKGTEPEVKIMY